MKQYFALFLRPPRPSFAFDMTPEERAVMMEHVAYWRRLLEKGITLAYGPVMDPAGPYGLGIVAADSQEQVEELIRHDPANGLNRYEYFPMRAVVRE